MGKIISPNWFGDRLYIALMTENIDNALIMIIVGGA
jgi:hypothetical protein